MYTNLTNEMQSYLFLITKNKPKVPVRVLETITQMLIESGVISIASVVIPAFFDKGSTSVLISGVTIAFFSWIGAILISWKL